MQSENLVWLVKPVPPVSPDKTLNEVGDFFLHDDYGHLLSLPVVHEDRPLGMISRYKMMRTLMKLYGRELHGKRPVAEAMNAQPVVVELNQSLEEAAQHIIRNIQFPITEDFILVEDGRYVGVGVVLDVLNALEQAMANRSSELARTLEELRSSQAQLIQSEKMASLGQMVAGVAHEMNTPLGYVRGNVEIIQEGLPQVQELLAAYESLVTTLLETEGDPMALEQQFAQVAELSQGVNSATFDDFAGLVKDTIYGVDQVSELVRNLRNFSRLDHARVEDINLNDSLDSALTIARNVIKYQTVTRDYADLPNISCSPSQVNQVFLNMLNNASQAMDGQGEIRLKTWYDDESVYASVADNGRGIAEEHLTKIFDPFFTTKKVGEGTGLGLAIVYKIVKEHDGDIQVRSMPGQGTTFTVRFPRQTVSLKKAG
jgi:signal transduction histidine kinase